ncbi:MAG: hypothetical protein CVV23_00750 [Ignavibacteriae bacterium HGW-Ignavibacteriae-2]|jgi:exopolysaccharide biosynthesis protein|nr:MAG: hypothetical protein CVV23_00750 [Ignavibacteriae bacterium HGW-Ignavibacteriae-2]
MKKTIIVIHLIFISLTFSSFSQSLVNKTTVRQIASGVKHYHVTLSEKPWNLNVLEIDLTNSLIHMETSTANDNIVGNERTSSQAIRKNKEGHEVIGAINGDFYNPENGLIIGQQVINGEFLKSEQSSNWSEIAFTENNAPLIGRFSFTGSVKWKDKTNTLHGVNSTRYTDHLVMYNHFFGNSTSTNQWGYEVLLKPVQPWIVNDTVKCVVLSVENRIGNMKISEGNVVLSGHGTSETFFSNLSLNDTVSIFAGLTAGKNKITQLISGFPKIVKEGKNYASEGYKEEGGSKTFDIERHPRTAVGFNEDKTKFFMFVVDGRQTISIGMSLQELADAMIEFGVYEGINLDGGGSSTMVVKNKIVNSPSDLSERAVANSLLVVSAEQMEIDKVTLTPDTVVTDLTKPIQFYFTSFDKYGYEQSYKFSDASTFITDPLIGSFTNNVFTPLNTGTTKLISSFSDVADTATINVEYYEGEKIISSMEKIDDWYISGKDIDTLKSNVNVSTFTKSEGEGCVELNYYFTYKTGVTNFAYINTDIPIYGVPESIKIDGLSDGLKHTLAFFVTDENGEEFGFLCDNTMTESIEFETFTAKLTNPIKTVGTSKFYFPIRIKKIAIALNSSKTVDAIYRGTIYLDNLRIKYPNDPTSLETNYIPSKFQLQQNYPNPFNPCTTIEYSFPHSELGSSDPISVSLIVYDILGHEVSTLVNEKQNPGSYKVEFNGKNLATGIYFYRLKVGNIVDSKRMILLK